MAKVFVSYSRKDIEFAKRLTAELQKSELDFWIDWEGIPPTVDWWREIEKGIEEADVFIFLISPDSAQSKICGKEIDTAVKNGKRIIPIVVREIEWQDTPPQLGHLNYIFFSRDDDFDTAARKLTTAVQTDYEWAATHRRLQVKALDWERNNKDNGFFLRGSDLLDAESDLATNSSKNPHPTDLQREYVLESRKTADRQRRVVTSISVIGFVVMALLTVFAFIQLNISRAQQLGFQAQVAFADDNYNMALLYAYQSNLIHKNKAADQVLSQLPYKNFVLGKAINTDTSIVPRVVWSPSGQLTSTEDGKVIIWDINSNQPAKIMESDLYVAISAAWSPSGQLASVTGDGKVIIWDINSSQPAKILKSDLYVAISAAWSASGQLASVSEDGKVIIWDINSGQPANILESDVYSVTNAVWSPAGQLASLMSWDDKVVIWDLNTGQPAQVLESDTYSFYQIAWSPSGQLASVSGMSDNTVIIWDLKTGQPAQILRGHTDSVGDIVWSSNGQLASASQDFRVIIWDLSTGRPAQTLNGHNATITDVAWSEDGQLASASLDKTVIVWDLKTGQPAQILKGHSGFVNGIGWSSNGQLASVSSDKTVIIWDLDINQPAQTLDARAAANSVAWLREGQLASGSRDGTVILWNLETSQPAQILTGHTNEVLSVAWSPNGQLASVSVSEYENPQLDKSQMIIWNLSTGQPAQIVTVASAVRSLAWSPHGKLASGSDDSRVTIWNAETGQPVQTLEALSAVDSVAWSREGRLASGHADGMVIIWDLKTGQPAQILEASSAVNSVAWSPDRKLASGHADGTIRVWNLKTGQPTPLLKAPSAVYSVGWSPSGQFASASWSVASNFMSMASTSGLVESEVIIWNIDTGQPIQTLKGHSNSINSIAWSPNGQLASASWDQTVRITRKDLIRGDFCNHIYRNMTIDEWLNTQGALYLYRAACPNLYDPSSDSLRSAIFQKAFSEIENLGAPKIISKATTYVFLAIVGPIIMWQDPSQLEIDPRIFLLTWQGRAILMVIYGVFLSMLFLMLRTIYKSAVWLWHKIRKPDAFPNPNVPNSPVGKA